MRGSRWTRSMACRPTRLRLPKAAMPKAASRRSNRSWASALMAQRWSRDPRRHRVDYRGHARGSGRTMPSRGVLSHGLAVNGDRAGSTARRCAHRAGVRLGGDEVHLAPFGAQAIQTVAMAASQHMARYGTTRETLGWIALNARANAALNPTAIYRDPLTMDDYLGARPISSPFGLYDCDALCDGAVAVVVSAFDAGRGHPMPGRGRGRRYADHRADGVGSGRAQPRAPRPRTRRGICGHGPTCGPPRWTSPSSTTGSPSTACHG